MAAPLRWKKLTDMSNEALQATAKSGPRLSAWPLDIANANGKSTP